MSKRIVLTTLGSLGDLHPYIALAIELNKRGHQAVIATSESYRSRVQSEGIEFYPVRPDISSIGKDLKQIKEAIKRSMDPYEGAKYIHFELVLPHLKESYDDLMEAVDDADMLITHPLSLGGPLVAEKTGILWVSSILAPILIVSAYDSFFLSNQNQFDPLNPLINGGLIWLAKIVFHAWSEPIRHLRAELGLPPGEDPLFEGKYSPDLVLALFSQFFARPQPDWPQQIYVSGFTFYDGKTVFSPELSRFLDAGPPPIIFTLGSSAVHIAGDFYVESALAAKQLGYRAVLLTGEDKDNLPQSLLSEDIVAFEYAPYSQLFSHAATIVHQGGFGTTAQALRSGRPMLIVPFSHDQPNNAERAKRLGVARTIGRTEYTSERVAVELRELLSNPMYHRRAGHIGRQLQAENGVQAACDQIEARLNAYV